MKLRDPCELTQHTGLEAEFSPGTEPMAGHRSGHCSVLFPRFGELTEPLLLGAHALALVRVVVAVLKHA